ncbi:hypothetical protein [Phaeobacter inhibens]|uniref:hypothetical protein n=1 Tax=Phaeobacter inhibens TaxID=221822 RepID=UPI0021A3CDF8|nr:hypothetical protein [Phaeobacter inhibens]UWS00452.1 hypothetical protein K4L03_01010 [Phaeobacter inhibens]
MSKVQDIVEKGAAFCTAVLSYSTAAAAGLSDIAVPAATLSAIGYNIWNDCAETACRRSIKKSVSRISRSPEFSEEDINRAKSIITDATFEVKFSPEVLRVAARSNRFQNELAANLTEKLVDETDHVVRRIFMTVFENAIEELLEDEVFHRVLTREILLDASQAAESIKGDIGELNAKLENFFAEFRRQPNNAVSAATRDTLNFIALKFGEASPEKCTSQQIRDFLLSKAGHYNQLLSTVEALHERTQKLEFAKKRAHDAFSKGILDEAERYLSTADKIEVEISLKTKETRAEIALLTGEISKAYRHYLSAANGYVGIDRERSLELKVKYSNTLYHYGLNLNNQSLRYAVFLYEDALSHLEGEELSEQFGGVKLNIAAALSKLAGYERDDAVASKMLQEARDKAEEAITVFSRLKSFNSLGLAFSVLGSIFDSMWVYSTKLVENTSKADSSTRLEQTEDYIELAIKTYSDALGIFRSIEDAVSYGATLSSLAITLARASNVPGRKDAEKLWSESESIFLALLEEYEECSFEWFKDKYNYSVSMAQRGSNVEGLVGDNLLKEAICSFLSICKAIDKDKLPSLWLDSHCAALLACEGLFERTRDAARLDQAEEIIRTVFDVQDEAGWLGPRRDFSESILRISEWRNDLV